MGFELSDRIKRLHENLERLKQLSTEPKVQTTYSILANAIKSSSSEKEVDYLEHLLAELMSENNEHEVLLYLNFNSRKYFQHYIQQVTTRLETEETSLGKLERLRYEQKIANQVPCEFDIAYTDKYPALQRMVVDWISEEIRFMEQTHGLSSAMPMQETEFTKKDFKFEFDMSVAQFAFMIKTFIETGLIQNKNISELIRFLSRFVKTKRSGNISYESFRMKYYNVESSTKDSLKNLLHNAIGHINTN